MSPPLATWYDVTSAATKYRVCLHTTTGHPLRVVVVVSSMMGTKQRNLELDGPTAKRVIAAAQAKRNESKPQETTT